MSAHTPHQSVPGEKSSGKTKPQLYLRRFVKAAWGWLSSPFMLISPTIRLSSQYRKLLYEWNRDKNEDSANKIAAVELLSKHLSRNIRFIFNRLTILVILVLGVLFCWSLTKVNSTHISVRLYVKSAGFQLAQETFLGGSNNTFWDSLAQVKFKANVVNGEYYLKQALPQLFTLEAINQSAFLKLRSLKLFANSGLRITPVTERRFTLDIRNQNSLPIDGSLYFDRGRLTQQNPFESVPDSTITYPCEGLSAPIKNIDFSFTRTAIEDFDLSVTGPNNFSFEPILVDKIDYDLLSPDKQTRSSSIVSGVIRLRETNGDSIMIYPGDTLSTTFVSAVRALVKQEHTRLVVSYEAEVSSLFCGSSIISKEKLSRMPRILDVSYQQQPIFWAVLIAVIPLFFSLITSQRQS